MTAIASIVSCLRRFKYDPDRRWSSDLRVAISGIVANCIYHNHCNCNHWNEYSPWNSCSLCNHCNHCSHFNHCNRHIFSHDGKQGIIRMYNRSRNWCSDLKFVISRVVVTCIYCDRCDCNHCNDCLQPLQLLQPLQPLQSLHPLRAMQLQLLQL